MRAGGSGEGASGALGVRSRINAAAETKRMAHVTPGSAQAMVYERKLAEARAYQAAVDPQAADYPHLAAGIGVTGDNVVAVTIIN